MNFYDLGIFGFDVSFYQDNNETPQQIDFVKMKNYGASFVVVKVGQNNFKDSDFDYNWKKAKEAGLPRAAYWFLDVYTSGKSQAQLCWSILKSDPPEGPIFVDFEKNLQGLIANWGEVYNFIVELQSLSGLPNEKIGIYTGYYIWIDYGPADKSQKDWFKKYLLWLAWYSSNPSIVSVPYPWTECIIWQDGTPAIGLSVGVESKEIDHDKLNGGVDKLLSIFGVPVPQATHTQPFAGFDEYIETVNGVNCHISIIDMFDKELKIRHFDGNLGYVSNVAKEPNVLCVFNGEDYDKSAVEKYYPKHPSYTDGVPYKFTNPGELPYQLNFSKIKEFFADFRNLPTLWNSTSFIRPLVIGGETAPDISNNPNKLEYTEIHACSAFGYTKDGKAIQIVTEGKVDPLTGVAYKGITVHQLVDLLKKYNTHFAGQHGGGGDSGKAIAGSMVNEPSDPTERAVVQVIEILGKGENNMNGTAKEKLGNTSTIRLQPSRYGTDTGKRISAFSTIEFTEIVPVIVMGSADNVNDKWFKLPDGNYVNYILAGKEYYTVLTMPTPDVPPTPTEDVFEVYKNGQLILKLVGKIEVFTP